MSALHRLAEEIQKPIATAIDHTVVRRNKSLANQAEVRYVQEQTWSPVSELREYKMDEADDFVKDTRYRHTFTASTIDMSFDSMSTQCYATLSVSSPTKRQC